MISTLDFEAASHILEGRRRTELGWVIFILEEAVGAGESSADERVCHGAEQDRNLESV